MENTTVCRGIGCLLQKSCSTYSNMAYTRKDGVIDYCEETTRPGYIRKC